MAKTFSKKMIAVLLMAVMVVVMGVTSVTAFADVTYPTSGNVIIYKDGSETELSMANDALVKAINSNDEKTDYGTYTATTDDSNVIVTIPIQRILKSGLYGYINSNTEFYINGIRVSEGTFTVTESPYTTGTMSITIPKTYFTENNALVTTIKLDVKFGITLTGSKTHIEYAHIEPKADMYIFVNPSTVVQ